MKKALFVGMAAGLLMLGVQSKAEAALAGSFHVCQGATCVDVNANSFGPTTVGDFTVRADGDFFQNSGFSQTATTGIQIFRTAGGNGTGSGTALDVWWAVTGYTLPAGGSFVGTGSGTATKAGTTTDNVSYTAWYKSDNTVSFVAPGTLIGSGNCTPAASATPASTSCGGGTVSASLGAGSPLYALISRTTFNIGVNDGSLFSSTGEATITAVPEPGSMMLLGTGLLGLGAVIRRRIKK